MIICYKSLIQPIFNNCIYIDPQGDLNHIAKKRLDSERLYYDQNESDLYLQLLNWQSKQIKKHPRKIICSKNLVVPVENQKGFNCLTYDILQGNNLNPYLSCYTEEANFQDTLFNTEGLVHFHLSDQPYKPKKKRKNELLNEYVDRTENFLIAQVTDTTVYFLTIVPHAPHDFDKSNYPNLKGTEVTFFQDKYLKIKIEEFPELLASRKLRKMEMVLEDGTPIEIGNTEKMYLKKANVNSIMSIGNFSYMDHLVTASGHSVKIKRMADSFNKKIVCEMIKIAHYLYKTVVLFSEFKYELKLKNFSKDGARVYSFNENGIEISSTLGSEKGIFIMNKCKPINDLHKKKELIIKIEEAISNIR